MDFDFGKLGTRILMKIPFVYSSITNVMPVQQITNIPNPCWSGDSNIGDAIAKNNFYWLGYSPNDITSPWESDDAPYSWIEYAHSFDWLYDVQASTIPGANIKVCNWLVEWFDNYDNLTQPIWRSDIVARRLTAWLVHYDYLFANTDKALRDKALISITKHFKHLQFTEDKDCKDDTHRITTLRGLIIGALALNQTINTKKYVIAICQILENNISPDGFNKNCDLPMQISYLKDCILTRITLHSVKEDVPSILDSVIDNMIVPIKMLRHPDGELAHMAGAGAVNVPVRQIINRANTKTYTPNSLKDSGFYHIVAEKTSLLFDASNRQNISSDNAGILSFEMSHNKNRIFVNCGYTSTSDDIMFDFCRNSNAHNTLNIEGHNAISLGNDSRLANATSSLTEEDGWHLLQGSHEGYIPICGSVVKRAIAINENGTEIRGQDKLEQIHGVHNLELHFHLHPKIDAMLLSNNREIILRQGKIGWSFKVSGGSASLEQSFYMEPDGTRRKSQQIIIKTKTIAQHVIIKWTISIL